jgi:hypothetical protein
MINIILWSKHWKTDDGFETAAFKVAGELFGIGLNNERRLVAFYFFLPAS